jgi:hypothetical protein
MNRTRLTRLLVPLVCVLLFTALGGSAASAAAGGTDRPWRVSGSLPGIITPATATTPTTIVVEGTVHAEHLGLTAFRNVVVCGTTCATGATSFTFVAANGDTVTASGGISGVRNFTGGTGRFAGATGTYTVTATTVFVTSTTFVITFTETGRISY